MIFEIGWVVSNFFERNIMYFRSNDQLRLLGTVDSVHIIATANIKWVRYRLPLREPHTSIAGGDETRSRWTQRRLPSSANVYEPRRNRYYDTLSLVRRRVPSGAIPQRRDASPVPLH